MGERAKSFRRERERIIFLKGFVAGIMVGMFIGTVASTVLLMF